MKNKFFIAILALCFGLFSCEKDKLEHNDSITSTEEQTHKVSDGMVVLGEKINDPYAIYNMKAAYSNLKSAGEDAPVDEIQPNKKYLRFLPKDEIEWDLLKTDTSLVLYDFPLDYEIEVYGTYYHDPELPDTAITWQYCVVPIDKEIPNIHHELLYEVFIPNFDTLELDTTLKSTSNSVNFYEQLVYESYKLTGNIQQSDDNLKSTKGWNPFKPKRWHPSGRITVHDDFLGSIPLEGANVHARWATHMEDCNTNSNGEFSMGGFIYEVNYSIKWDRYEFGIREEDWGQAWYNGPKQKGAWNLHISSDKSLRYATIHRAAHHYYYGNTGGIKRPPQNSWYNRKLIIGYYHRKANDDINGDANPYWPSWYTWPDLRVFGERSSGWRNTQDIYATTIHEIAHASHWDLSGKTTFIGTDTKVAESWARGVQWHLTRMIYAGYSPEYSGNYTGIVEDMVDGVGGYDQVSGYTMSELEGALKEKKTWNSWRDNIINSYNNGTEGNLQALFNFW